MCVYIYIYVRIPKLNYIPAENKGAASDWMTGISTLGCSGGLRVSPPLAGISSKGGGVASLRLRSAIAVNHVTKPEPEIEMFSRDFNCHLTKRWQW